MIDMSELTSRSASKTGFGLWPLSLIAILALLAVNAPLEYEDNRVFPALGNPNTIDDAQVVDIPEPNYIAAGWPSRFYVRVNYSDAPSLVCFDIWRLLQNIALYFGVLAVCGFLHYGMAYRQPLSGPEIRRATFGLKDMIFATTVAALLLGYWRWNVRVELRELELAAEIVSKRGAVVTENVFPRLLVNWLPEWAIVGQKRITGIILVKPSTDLMQRTVVLPHLKAFRVGGGDYDLRLLDRLVTNPLLHDLRISGRPLDDLTICSIGEFKQLQTLNLMRTNIDSRGLDNLGEMPRLRRINLVHTDVEFSKKPTAPDCFKGLRELVLGHPPNGISDKLQLEKLVSLESLICVEYDQLKDRSTVTLSIAECPKLAKISLDPLRRFNLNLSELPNLSALVCVSNDFKLRLEENQTLQSEPWLGELSLRSVPKLIGLNFCAIDLESISIDNNSCKALGLSVFQRRLERGELWPEYAKTESIPQSRRQKWIDQLGTCTGLTKLDLALVPLQGLNLTRLVENTSLQILDLSESGITAKQLESLVGMRVEQLILGGLEIDGQSLQRIVPKLENLTQLLADPMFVKSLRIEMKPKLERLFNSGVRSFLPIQRLRLVDMPTLAETIDLPPNLEYLHLDDVPALRGLTIRSPLPARSLIQGLRDLRYFAAGGQSVDDALAEELLKCNQLEMLTLAYTSVSPALLARIGQLPNLKYLALPGCAVTDEVVSKWGAMGQIRSLILDDTSLTDEGLRRLPLTQLTSLSLQRTKITSDSIHRFAKVPGESPLRSLGIGGISLTSNEIQSIANCSQLAVLTISDCMLDEATIAPLLQTSELRWIQLHNIQGDGKALKLLARIPMAVFDLQDCENAFETTDALTKSNRVLERSQIESGTCACPYSGFETSVGLRPVRADFYYRVEEMALPLGEIYYERFMPPKKSEPQ